MSLFSTELQNWFKQNKRDLPWRNTQDPYAIWLSEVILQQTRVQQGMSYYLKFLNHFPTVFDLSNASEQNVLNLWQGLGYYSRARNMHKTAQCIVQNYNGVFPNRFEELLKLPGVGYYTAAAVASFAFNLPYAVVDGNVYRVLSRYFNVDEFIDTGQGQKFYQNLADELLDREFPAQHNQAIMELGALVCTPKNPNCELCPLLSSCEAFKKNTIDHLPRKKVRVKVKNRTLNYLITLDKEFIYLRKRETKDIYANMFEFPQIDENLLAEANKHSLQLIQQMNHKLTHQNLSVNFFASPSLRYLLAEQELLAIPLEELKNYPLPRVIEKFLEERYNLILRL
jgi:A/G-specific adenine glycosylase